MLMKKTCVFYTDPGHGWLRVKRADIDTLGIRNQITEYSYVKGDWAYLEEDCDAGTFMEAAKKAGWEVEIKQSHTNSRSFIRRLPRFVA
jgi:hypothetical protein